MQNLINTISKYIKLSEQDIELMHELFNKKEIKAKDSFLLSGNVCNSFAFIEKGLLRHAVYNDGVEQTIFFSSENDFVCDFESFLSRKVSNKDIIALEDTELFIASFDHMQQFYSNISSGERFDRLFIEESFINVVKHIVSMLTDDAEQRYLNFMTSFKHLQQRIPQHYIASFVGVTPQSLSRIRRKMAGK